MSKYATYHNYTFIKMGTSCDVGNHFHPTLVSLPYFASFFVISNVVHIFADSYIVLLLACRILLRDHKIQFSELGEQLHK